MKMSPPQMNALALKVFEQWKQAGVRVKTDDKTLLEKMVAIIRAELQRDVDLERDVNQMLDQLERSHNGQFERHKMYPMLKNKLAKERKLVL